MLVYLLCFLYIIFNVLVPYFFNKVVEIKGVEPLTSCLQGRRSSQLSYIPICKQSKNKEIFLMLQALLGQIKND